MKIKNLKYTLGMLSLSTALSLTGCSSNNCEEELETPVQSLEEIEVVDIEPDKLLEESLESSTSTTEEVQFSDAEILEKQETIEESAVEMTEEKEKVVLNSEEMNTLVNELKSELGSSVDFSIYCYLDNISIFIYSNSDKDSSYKLSDDFYDKFNLLLSQDYSYSLSLCEVGSEIDFSRLDLSNINEVHLEFCKETFNYDAFAGRGYDILTLVDIPLANAKNIVEGCTNSELELEYSNYNYEDNDNLEFVRFLVQNNICLGKYSGIDINNNEDEIYSLLSCLNAREVAISEFQKDSNSVVPILNLDLKLNDKIETFYIFDYHYRELGNIKIISDNSDFCLDLRYAKITDNTRFSLPDNSALEMAGVYTNINAFYDLNNISEFSYYDCDSDISVYGYKEIFDETIDEIKAIHGNVLVK